MSSLKSTIIDLKELIRRMWTEGTSDIEPQSRICVTKSGLAKLQFCAKFCANCHSANFSAVRLVDPAGRVAGARRDCDKHIVSEAEK